MYIKEMLSQHRRDFNAVYSCEHCGHEGTGSGYDDTHFHQQIIPKMQCKKCGKVAPESYVPHQTRYPDHVQV